MIDKFRNFFVCRHKEIKSHAINLQQLNKDMNVHRMKIN